MKSKTAKERLQKQLIQTRIANKEDKRQQIRKNIERSSRLLDNYYNPNLHPNHWQTTGAIKHKHNYIYGETGLGYKIPSLQKESSNNQQQYNNSKIKQRIIKQQMHYTEFDHLDNNEIIVTIEHCSECEKHQSHTNHVNNIYYHIAKLIQKSIITRFPFIKVYLKPVDEDKLSSRIGAFEIQYASKINNQILIVPLFSKLNTGIWPSIYNVIYKISSVVPEFDVKCILYDGEEERNENINMNANINNQNAYLLPTKYENIKINLYQFDTNKIQQYSQEAKDAIDVIYNPKKKIMMYYEKQNKSNSLMMLRPKSSKDNNSQNEKILRSSSTQKQNYSMCSASTSSFGNYSAVSTYDQCNKSNNNKSHLQLQHQLNFNKTNILSNLHKLKQIDDSDVINSVKGKLLSSGYTNIEGVLTFHNVPYDTYIIEIENNRNFLQCGTVLKFSHIMKSNINNSIYTINKIFRLKRQIDAYLEVYLYSNNNNNNNEHEEMKLIENARVILVRNYSNEIVGLNSQLEDKFELKESEIVRGRYEIITTPGKMRLNVLKEGYQPIDKLIELKCGENKINIELQ